jgi:hypothetical protein
MQNRKALALVVVAAVVAIVFVGACGRAEAGAEGPEYQALQPIREGNLTIFPVVAASTHDTSNFRTLDEGLRSGEVVVTEAGRFAGLRRRPVPLPDSGGAVNSLVLVNNSHHPLLLLAGEIVTGGKQDRVIGKDRLIPVDSDPVDLSVFCVEPGRWTATSDNFGALRSQLAQPSVRARAMADKNQGEVWNEVRKSQQGMIAAAPAAAEVVAGTTSYARTADSFAVKKEVDKVAAPIERDYRNLIGELRDRRAVGVVVAVNGRIIWSDIFASTALLDKYWPKLVRSYAAEALTTRANSSDRNVDLRDAQVFLDNMTARHETVETEPGIFRYSEGTAPRFKLFELTSLLPKTGFALHLAKMATQTETTIYKEEDRGLIRPMPR